MIAKMVEHVSPVSLQLKLLDLSIRTVEPCQMLNLCITYSEHSWLEEERQFAQGGAYANIYSKSHRYQREFIGVHTRWSTCGA